MGMVAAACGDSGGQGGSGGRGDGGQGGEGGAPPNCRIDPSICHEGEYCAYPDCEEGVGVCETRDSETFPCSGRLCQIATDYCVRQKSNGECVPDQCELLPLDCHDCDCLQKSRPCGDIGECYELEDGGFRVVCDG